MALRQLFYLNNTNGITWLIRCLNNQRYVPARYCSVTVWAIVFIFACTAICEPKFSLQKSSVLRVYDVSVTRFSSTYHPRIYRGLLATDGKQHRFSFYWLDPVAECEKTDSLAFSDFLFTPDKVSYWHHNDVNEQHNLPLGLSQASQGGQLPMENTFDSILLSILNLVMYNRTIPADNTSMMETARFFQRAKLHDNFHYTVKLSVAVNDDEVSLTGSASGNFKIPNQLPFGRKYCKQVDQKDKVVWHLSKTIISRDLVRVTVKPKPLSDIPGLSDIFDANSLSLWSAVPEPYRQFWSFWHRSIELQRAPSVLEAKRLYTEIESFLHGALPNEVKLALLKLLFKASLETGSYEAVSSSAQQYFHAYKYLAQQPVDLILVELGRITKELRKKWSDEKTRDFILPLLKPLVDAKVFNREFVDKAVFDQIKLRGRPWFFYGQLVLESVKESTSLDPEFLEQLTQIVKSPENKENITDSKTNDKLFYREIGR